MWINEISLIHSPCKHFFTPNQSSQPVLSQSGRSLLPAHRRQNRVALRRFSYSAGAFLLFGFQSLQRGNTMKTTSFGVLIFALAALMTTAAGSLREKRGRAFSVFSASDSSSSSSSFSFSTLFDNSGGICLNGGSSVPSLTTGEHMFCLCPDGFEGTRCETATRVECYEGVGLYYKGKVSKSQSGRTCEDWNLDTRERYMTSDINAGRHNYCRYVHK
ncbi:uncharacterized protein LOC121963793 [Plectropomus leopardus]|uniref:uncharacterized protein LOC121963793 n=1 Tax=Plectropomus leopardus TaxID=160734 RepID=UPI001C4B2318|nr:uncharacterized protein LOC121963793 [Plectropomus leopardus]